MAAISAPSSEFWRRLSENDDMLNLNRKIFQSGIARRLIIYVVLFSSLITLLITAIQLRRDYVSDISLIENRLQQTQDVHLKALTATLWVSDTKELRTHLEGISQLRDMQFLEVRDQEKVWVSVGTPQSRNVISRQFPMIYPHRGRDIQIGTLTVIASLSGVYQRLISKVWVILVSNGIKTFLVAAFILIIFHALITRHLIRIADFAGAMDINKLDKQLDLDRKSNRKQEPDELDLVVNAINQMQKNTRESLSALGRSESRFKTLARVSPVGIFNTDAQGNCVYTNERWRELAGLSEAQALGEGWAQALYPEDRERVFARWYQATADCVPFSAECRYQRPDGKITWLLVLAEAELDAAGEVVGYVGTATDITE
ncbi:MAG: PAS domain S-box protein, partial [Acidiferrobacterales bacterium]